MAPAETFSLKSRGGSARPPACLFSAEQPWPGPGASLEVKGPGSAGSSLLRRVSQTPGTRSLRTDFRGRERARAAPPGSPQQGSGARPGDQVARPGRDTPHRAALTQLGLNGRRARHHVRPPLLHNRRGPLPQSGDSTAASPEGQPLSSRCAVRGPAGAGSRGRRPYPGPAGIRGRHALATARRDAEPRLLALQVVGREGGGLFRERWRRAGAGRIRPSFPAPPAVGMAQLFRTPGGWVLSVPAFETHCATSSRPEPGHVEANSGPSGKENIDIYGRPRLCARWAERFTPWRARALRSVSPWVLATSRAPKGEPGEPGLSRKELCEERRY